MSTVQDRYRHAARRYDKCPTCYHEPSRKPVAA
jgi:hypothetical protein